MKGRTFLAGLILAVSFTGTACATRIIPLPRNPGTQNPPPPPPPSQSQEYHRPGPALPPHRPEGHKPLPPRDDKGHRLPPPPEYRRPGPGDAGRGPVPVRPPKHRPEYVPEHHRDVRHNPSMHKPDMPPPPPPERHHRPLLPPERRR